MNRIAAGCGLGLLVVLAFLLRSLSADAVFATDGSVVFVSADAYYHARRALYSFARFPLLLLFDPYLGFPDGSTVPWPPLFDWTLAATARGLGESQAVFEQTAAWASPVLGALTLLPTYVATRALAGAGAGLGAAALLALLPVAVVASRVGNPDHHAAVTLLGASFLALSASSVRDGSSRRRLLGLGVGLFGLRVLLVLSWSGSLLYVALGEGALLLGAVVTGRSGLLGSQAAGAFCAALFIVPWVAATGTPPGGPFSTITLSWFHVVALAGVAAVASTLAVFEAMRPASSTAVRGVRAVTLAAVASALLLAFPAPRAALSPSTQLLTGSDDWYTERNLEARALFGPAIPGAQVPRSPPTANSVTTPTG